jgi:hypothetical protein
MLGAAGQGDREERRTQSSQHSSTDDDFIPEIEEEDVPL